MSSISHNAQSLEIKKNISAVFKKGDPSLPFNYRPILLLNTVEKVFERILFKYMFNFLKDREFFTSYQSGFLPGDSTVNQLTYLYNTFCKALDNGLEVRVVFFDISKAFDKVWHRGLIFKLEQAGIRGDLLLWFSDNLQGRRQRVVLPGAESDYSTISAGVPQGSILGPLLFLIYINDIVANIRTNINLFADDTSLHMVVNSAHDTAAMLQSDINSISSWADTWLVQFNPSKSESLIISRKTNKPFHPPLVMSNVQIPTVNVHKHLGVLISSDGSWHDHIDYIKTKAWARIHVMRRLKFSLDRRALEIVYVSFVRPILEYADVLYDNCCQYEKDELDKIQNEAARIVSGCTKLVSLADLYREIGWETLGQRRRKHKLILFYKMINGLCPPYLCSLVPDTVGARTAYSLRNADQLQTVQTRTVLYSNSFLPSVVNEWSMLCDEAKASDTVQSFKAFLNKDRPEGNALYNIGDRKLQVLHTRLRTRCSSLNQHLFVKNVVESPLCQCGHPETTQHFLLQCQRYSDIRHELIDKVSPITCPTVDILLYGDNSKDLRSNSAIFEAVQKFINDSQRFER